MAYPIKIQVLIKEETKYGTFCDALYFTQDEYYSLTEDEITQKAFQRVFNWVDAIENKPPEIEVTKVQLEDEKAELLARISDIDSKIPGAK